MPDTMSVPSLDTTLPLLRAHPLIGREENMKLLFDDVMSDISHDRKTSLRLSETRQLEDIRSSRFHSTVDHAFLAAIAIALQTGETENDQTVDPIKLSTADAPLASEATSDAGVAAAAQAIATSLGNLASALVPIITASAGVVSAQSLAALLATVVAAAGNSAGTSAAK